MISSEHNERSDESKAETSGLQASSLEEHRKRIKSNDEESEPGNYRPEKLERSELYPTSGLNLYLHGVEYKSKLLMLCLIRGVDQGYAFRLATNMVAAKRFGDIVFQYIDGEKCVHRFLEVRHKLNGDQEIRINDLLTDTGKIFNLQEYFISYRKIKSNPEFGGDNKIKDMIIYTNIGFKWGDKRGALTLSDDIFDREIDETILKTDLRRFKKYFCGREEIVSALENATDLIKLAKNLVGHVLNDEKAKKRSDDLLKSYRFPLEREIIDYDRKKLRPEFVTCAESLSSEAKNFRQAIEKVYRDQRKTYNLHTDPVIETQALYEFVEVVAELIEEGKSSKIIEIKRRKNVIKENFDKLACYVLVKKAGRIRFSSAFLNEGKLPGNLGDFRKKLLAELSKKNITFKDIAEYTFQVYGGFQIRDEIYVNINTFWEIIGEKEFDLFDNLSIRGADLQSVDVFVEELVHLIQESRKNDERNVEIKKYNRIYKNMIKLAEYAIVENDEIRFSREFLEDTLLPYNLNKFRDRLKDQVKDLDKLRFVIKNFPITRLPSDSITNIKSEIDGFLDKLVFAVDQPNEIELGYIIDAEIGELRGFNLINRGFIRSEVQRYVFDWMRDRTGSFLTRDHGEQLFDKILKELANLQLTAYTLEYSAHMQEMNIRFTKDKTHEKLREFLENENTTQLFILMSMPKTIIGLIQVHSILEEITDYQKSDSYNFLRFNSFLRMHSLVVKAFASRSKRLLIIECKSIEVNEQASYTDFLKAMKSNGIRKIILITDKKDGTPVDKFKEIFGDSSVEKKIEVNSLLNLDKVSRKKIIEEKKVIFQGEEVPLSALVTDEESMKLINVEALAKLINNETLEIGKSLENLGDVRNYYIPRTLQRQAKINQSLMEDKSRFYVATDNQLRGFNSQRNKDIVVISDNDELFKELGNEKNCKKHNIHWLKLENDQYIWQESKGTVAKLRKFVDSDSVESFSPKKVTDISNRITIIAAEPGMGKSTMLTHLSVQTKESEPTVWVAKVNLSVDCSKKLKEMVDGKITFDHDNTINFLLAGETFTSEMPEYQFLKYCYRTGNMILLFDGFDEISPYYNNKVIELLKFLKGTKVKKIWVTTRPYDIKTNLEDELGSFSYVLKEFSEPKQKQFLRDFWKAKLNLDELNDERANTFIDTLLKSFSGSINDCRRKFINIPLQIKMIADICKDTFREFLESNEEDIDGLEEKLEINLELLSLYNSFFELKFRIVFTEKQPDWHATNSNRRGVMDRERDSVVGTHEILALENLYPNDSFVPREKVISSLEDIRQGANKIGMIDRVVDDKPVFVHKSFAEYFAALYFSKNWRKENVKQLLKERIFSEESILIRNFFDRMLANNELEHSESANVYKLHIAVLDNNESEVHELLKDDESLFDKTDVAGRNLLHLAAACGHEGIARSFLEAVQKRADHNVENYRLCKKDKLFDWTPLTYADKCNYWNVAELFLQTEHAGEDMFEAIKNIRSRIGDDEEPLLHRAAEKGYLKIAELLLEKGARIDVRDRGQKTPLHLAARAGHYKIVNYFIQQGADIEATASSGWTVLHFAGAGGNLETFRYLVDETDIELYPATGIGDTVLHVAAEYNRLEIVEYLINNKVGIFETVGESGETALHSAASKGNLEIVKYFIKNIGGSSETVDGLGRTALHSAACMGQLEIVKYLHENKKYRLEAADKSGRTTLHLAVLKGKLEIVEYLLEKNVSIEAVDKSGCTVLHLTAEKSNLKLVKYLIDKKDAKFDATNGLGRTALHLAAWWGNWEIVKYLLVEKKADFKAADKLGYTVLHIAASKGNLETIKYLNDKDNKEDATLETADGLGRTALHFAALKGKLQIVKYLVGKKKVRLDLVDKLGRTALCIAVLKGNLKIVEYLTDKENAKSQAISR